MMLKVRKSRIFEPKEVTFLKPTYSKKLCWREDSLNSNNERRFSLLVVLYLTFPVQ